MAMERGSAGSGPVFGFCDGQTGQADFIAEAEGAVKRLLVATNQVADAVGRVKPNAWESSGRVVGVNSRSSCQFPRAQKTENRA